MSLCTQTISETLLLIQPSNNSMQGELLYNMDLKEKKKDISIIILLTTEQTARQCDICCLPAHIYTISIFLSKNISTLNPVIKVALFR